MVGNAPQTHILSGDNSVFLNTYGQQSFTGFKKKHNNYLLHDYQEYTYELQINMKTVLRGRVENVPPTHVLSLDKFLSLNISCLQSFEHSQIHL